MCDTWRNTSLSQFMQWTIFFFFYFSMLSPFLYYLWPPSLLQDPNQDPIYLYQVYIRTRRRHEQGLHGVYWGTTVTFQTNIPEPPFTHLVSATCLGVKSIQAHSLGPRQIVTQQQLLLRDDEIRWWGFVFPQCIPSVQKSQMLTHCFHCAQETFT